MEPRKKHGWPFWIAVTLIVLPQLYVGSFGPVHALDENVGVPTQAVWEFESWFYAPVIYAARNSRWFRGAMDWYMRFWLPPGMRVGWEWNGY